MVVGGGTIVETCKIFVKALYKDIAGAVAEDNDRILDAIPERQPITDIQVAEHIGITQNIKASAKKSLCAGQGKKMTHYDYGNQNPCACFSKSLRSGDPCCMLLLKEGGSERFFCCLR